MKVGDLVRFKPATNFTKVCGIVTRIDDTCRQVTVEALFGNNLQSGIWEGHLEVVDESR